MEELMQLFLECKSHFNDMVKQNKEKNVNNYVLFKQIQILFELVLQNTQIYFNSRNAVAE